MAMVWPSYEFVPKDTSKGNNNTLTYLVDVGLLVLFNTLVVVFLVLSPLVLEVVATFAFSVVLGDTVSVSGPLSAIKAVATILNAQQALRDDKAGLTVCFYLTGVAPIWTCVNKKFLSFYLFHFDMEY